MKYDTRRDRYAVPSVADRAGLDDRNRQEVLQIREHAVVIAARDLAGSMLAAELALAGVDVAVVERRRNHALATILAREFSARVAIIVKIG